MSGPAREERIAALRDAMSAEEQIMLLAGQDFWSAVPIERLGLPSIKVSDGPNGVRGGGALVRVAFSMADIRAMVPLVLTGHWTDAPARPAAPGISPAPDLARRNT